jgi:putative spermidine/putrescine transport system ATP-binding protein
MSIAARIDDCARTFADGTVGLHPTTLEFPAGSVTALLGPSGCGKTTTLRLLAGLAAPDRGGRVLFDGRDVTRLPVEKRGIGMVFQGYALFPNRDVAGNIGYGLEVRGVNRADRDRRIAEMLRLTRLEGLAARRVDQLSGGQRQRVALARALASATRARSAAAGRTLRCARRAAARGAAR